MKYGIQTRLKSTYPFVRKPQKQLSAKAQLRLKWMEYVDNGKSIPLCSRHFDIPERTIRFWRKRYQKWNLSSLEDKCKRPHNTRYTSYNEEIVKEIKRIRHKRPWGKNKIQVILKRKGILVGQNKIQKIINITGLKRVKKSKRKSPRRNRKHMYTVPRDKLKEIGGLIYFDVKHIYMNGDGKKVYQFTAIDHATRMVVAKIYLRISSECGKEFFEYVQNKLEHEISFVGSDNGSEFLGDFEKLLSELNINHVFSSPRSPKQNPFVERVINSIIKECLEFEGLASDINLQQDRLDKYLYDYNYIRPHESLNNLTPSQKYDMLDN